MKIRNYCDPSVSIYDILSKSIVLKKLNTEDVDIIDKIYPEDLKTEGWIFTGTGGDCGNFGIALNRHLCNRGLLMGITSDLEKYSKDPYYIEHQTPIGVNPFEHILLQLDDRFVDYKGVSKPSEFDLETKKDLLAFHWGVSLLDSDDMKYFPDWIKKLSDDEFDDAINPRMIGTSEREIFKSLEDTDEERITHYRDLFCILDDMGRFNKEKNRCEIL